MKHINNIAQFFRKRLLEENPAEESWNMPSDSIWEAAAVHFPKEKQKKRWFIYFLCGATLFAVASFFIFTNNKTNKQIESYANTIKNNVPSTKIQEAPLSTLPSSRNTKDSEQEVTTQIIDTGSTIKDKLIKKGAKTKEVSSQIKFNSPTPFIQSHLSSINKTTIDKLRAKNAERNSTPQSNFASPISIQTDNNKSVINNSPLLKYEAATITSTNTISTGSEKGFNKNNVLHILKLETKQSYPLTIIPTAFDRIPTQIIIQQQPLYKWEVGLEWSRFTKNQQWIIEDLLDEDDTYTLGLRESAYNFHIAKTMNKRFSLSSGLLYSKLEYDLRINEIESYDSEMSSTNLKKRIEDILSIGNISLNDNSRDISVDLLPAADLTQGDQLLVEVFLPITLHVYQLPLLLNYHLTHNKWDGFMMTGLSIDLIDITIKDIDVQVLKNNEMIISPLNFNPINDRSLAGSLYLGGGIKYNITDRFNISSNYKIDLTETRLSKLSAGVYFRF